MSNNVDYDEEDAFLYGTLGNETTTAQGEEEAFVVKQEICFVVSLLLLVLIVGFIISYAIVNPSSNKIKNEEIEDIFDAKAACDHLNGFNVMGRYLIVLYYQPNKVTKKMNLQKKEEELKELKSRYGIPDSE